MRAHAAKPVAINCWVIKNTDKFKLFVSLLSQPIATNAL